MPLRAAFRPLLGGTRNRQRKGMLHHSERRNPYNRIIYLARISQLLRERGCHETARAGMMSRATRDKIFGDR